ncbi:hypothetical protein CDAR_620171 [Caerostris darwini]|uniref:Uncharacterized protein n=1 Tax=Caerostris darwini TaxID=1538125 RepID=A0AAV4VL81_9ARAC|nr:hypothetical protein CDAR_620171 [Caerostris darwini]
MFVCLLFVIITTINNNSCSNKENQNIQKLHGVFINHINRRNFLNEYYTSSTLSETADREQNRNIKRTDPSTLEPLSEGADREQQTIKRRSWILASSTTTPGNFGGDWREGLNERIIGGRDIHYPSDPTKGVQDSLPDGMVQQSGYFYSRICSRLKSAMGLGGTALRKSPLRTHCKSNMCSFIE